MKGASHHSAFMGSHPTINHTFSPLTTQWMSSPSRKWECVVSPSLYLIVFVWCESGETGGRSSRFPWVTPVAEIFSLDRVAVRILSNINGQVPLQKQPTALTCWMFPEKGSTTDLWLDCNADLTGGTVSVGCGWTASAWNS